MVVRSIRSDNSHIPKGPYTARLRTLVPRTYTSRMAFGARVLKWAVYGPFGYHNKKTNCHRSVELEVCWQFGGFQPKHNWKFCSEIFRMRSRTFQPIVHEIPNVYSTFMHFMCCPKAALLFLTPAQTPRLSPKCPWSWKLWDGRCSSYTSHILASSFQACGFHTPFIGCLQV